MPGDPFPRAALDANRAGRLTPEQASELLGEARQTRRTGLMVGVVVVGFGGLLVAGALTGRIAKDATGALAVGAVIAAVGLLLLLSGGRSRDTKVEEQGMAARVEMLEGPFRRVRHDRSQPSGLDGLLGVQPDRHSANPYDYYVFVGDRRFDVPQSTWEAAPEDGIVRAYLLAGSARIVNLERIADAPPPAFAQAIAARMGVVLPGVTPPGMTRPGDAAAPAAGAAAATSAGAAAAAPQPDSPQALAAAIVGTWQGLVIPVRMTFNADGTVDAGASGRSERKRWEIAGPGLLRLDGEPFAVEFDADGFLGGDPGGPRLGFRRVV